MNYIIQIKKIILLFLILLLTNTIIFTIGRHYYNNEKPLFLNIDSYLLLYILQKKDSKYNNANIINPLKGKHKKSPFIRLFNKNKYTDDLIILKNENNNNYWYFNSFYRVNKKYEKFLEEAWDDILLKALYSDIEGYNDKDFQLLLSLKKHDGGYTDTHVLLTLLLLKENHGYNRRILNREIIKLKNILVNALKKEKEFSDLFAERIVFLYWAGYGNCVKKEWISIIKSSQKKDLGWGDEGSDPHATGLALLSIIYFNEDKRKQQFYF